MTDYKDLAKRTPYDIDKDEFNIADVYMDKALECDESIAKSKDNHPYKDESQAHFTKSLSVKYATSIDKAFLKDTLREIKSYKNEIDAKFYLKEARAKDIELKDLQFHALNEWEKQINAKIKAFQDENAYKIQEKACEFMREWIENLQKTKSFFSRLGEFAKGFQNSIMQSMKEALRSGKRAKDFDDSLGNFSDTGDDFKSWLDFLEQDSVKNLCDMLGHISGAKKTLQMQQITIQKTLQATIKDTYAKEQISGITLGNEIANTLPSELRLLNDEDFEILFDLKYTENTLLNFLKDGYKNISVDYEEQSEIEVETKEPKGPFIICVDTSGSMQGAPENIAKAITLYLSARASEQNRDCYLISFSTSIDTLDLTPPKGFAELMQFLRMSFNGGTDPLPALKHGIEKMKSKRYKNADLLMISDFNMSDDLGSSLSALKNEKNSDNKYYALYVLQNQARLKDGGFFDKEFVYNSSNGNILGLVDFVNSLN